MSFRFNDYEAMLEGLLDAGYRFVTLREYFLGEAVQAPKIIVNRIDVDVRVERLHSLRRILQKLGVRASIYPRLHASSYNLLNLGTVRLLQDLVADGHEIGLHSELMDAQGLLELDGASLLRAELHLLETLLKTKIHGTAAHGDMTPFNNLHFWRSHAPAEFGLIYEAYDPQLWNHCRYVSDSEWTRWKSYDDGALREGDRRTPLEHVLEDSPNVLYLLTHPESWYEHYIHE